MKQILMLGSFIFLCCSAKAQVQVNRYVESKISTKGISGKLVLDKGVNIPAIDIDKVLDKWEIEKIQKFAEPVLVDITPLAQGTREVLDDYVVSRIKITAENAHSVTVYFDTLKLTDNAELYIYNLEGTILTGPITKKENNVNGNLWASNVFQGNTIIVEFKAPVSEEKSNALHIKKILYGLNPKNIRSYKDSLTGPGFNTSSPCNANLVCVSGWDQESRAVAQVIDEYGGACSASLIMNACNSNRPYILTANHCVEINGNAMNTNNTTFEFLWISSTCTPSTNTSATLLFNGATIRSRWQQTDFALLELNQEIPQIANLAFLGWSRSTTPPNSSVSIHHPRGDIMKISVENSTASIGSIGTFANTAWRVQWDVGTTQKGSSGGPLFDQSSHKLIGQCYSNTQPEYPPCNQLIGGANYGRFDVSWDGGGTSTTRLKDWLDPNNTGAVTTNTTNVSSLLSANMSLSLSGSGCTNDAAIQVIGAPGGSTFTWTSSNTQIAYPVNNAASTPIAVVGNGQVTFTLTVTNPCYKTTTLTTQYTAETPYVYAVISNYIPYPEPSCYDINGFYFFQATSPQTSSLSDFQWGYRIIGSTTSVVFNSSYIAQFNFPQAGTYEVFVRPVTSCGLGLESTKTIEVTSDCSSGFRKKSNVEIFPNPARDQVTIRLSQLNETQGVKKLIDIREIKVMDKLGVIKRLIKYSPKTISISINIGMLPNDVYYLEVSDGINDVKLPLSIQK